MTYKIIQDLVKLSNQRNLRHTESVAMSESITFDDDVDYCKKHFRDELSRALMWYCQRRKSRIEYYTPERLQDFVTDKVDVADIARDSSSSEIVSYSVSVEAGVTLTVTATSENKTVAAADGLGAVGGILPGAIIGGIVGFCVGGPIGAGAGAPLGVSAGAMLGLGAGTAVKKGVGTKSNRNIHVPVRDVLQEIVWKGEVREHKNKLLATMHCDKLSDSL